MTLIRLPSHAIYRTDTVVKLLADSPLRSLGEARCAEYLWEHHGIARHQIKGDFLAIRIKANNLRAARYWRSGLSPAAQPSPMPGPAADPSRVAAAGCGALLGVTA